MPGCIVSATTASFTSVGNRRRRATPLITSTFENVSDIGVSLGLSLGPPASLVSGQNRVHFSQPPLDIAMTVPTFPVSSRTNRATSRVGRVLSFV